MRVNHLILLMGIVLLGCNSTTVSFKPESRNITVTGDSTKCYTSIFQKPYKDELKNTLQYHWYSSDKLGSNYGGYNGYLLNGDFKKVDLRGNLLEQGKFSSGLKDGVWKSWYLNGNLKKVESWKMGVLSSSVIEYNKDGSLVYSKPETTQSQGDSTSIKAPWYKQLFKKDKKGTK